MEFGCWQDAADVLEHCPADSPMKHYALAYAKGKTGDTDAAKACVQTAETLPTDFCFPATLMEMRMLEYAVSLLPAAPRAHYFLGELLYDKKQYGAAIRHWETAVREQPDLAPAHRNLSIAYYNHGDRNLAAARIAEACRLEPRNSRFLLEQEQLLRRLGRPVRERLAILESRRDILPGNYALMLSWISLLNQDGQAGKALDLITHYTFHVWEGGEGKVAGEYKAALFSLAEKALEEGRLSEAADLARRTLIYPENLGEGKLENVPDNRAWYLMGCACRQAGNEEQARDYFLKAASGSPVPEPVLYYNDQPSDYIYYQGLAFHALGDNEKAAESFRQLILFGEQHLTEKVGYDFFAVSLPELEVYQDDIQQRHDDYCRHLADLGHRGMKEIQGVQFPVPGSRRPFTAVRQALPFSPLSVSSPSGSPGLR